MSTLKRQLITLREIPKAPRRIDTATIAQRLRDQGVRVTLRTVQRDLEKLATILPLECDDRHKPYSWAWMAGAQPLDIPNVDEPTALAVELVERLLTAGIKPRDGKQEAQDSFKLVVQRGSEPPDDRTMDVIGVVCRALHTGHRLRAMYRDGTELSRLDVSPLALVLGDADAHLIASVGPERTVCRLSLRLIEHAVVLAVPPATADQSDVERCIESTLSLDELSA